MKKSVKQLIALGCVAVILGGAYGGLSAWNSYSGKKEKEEKEKEEEAAQIYLCSVEEAAALKVENENGTFSFSYDQEEETWSYDKDDRFPLKQSSVTSITGKLKSLQAVRKLEGAEENLSVYGLDEPSVRMTVSDADGNTVGLEIGNVSEASGDYYVQIEGEDAVYTVGSSFVDVLALTEDDMLEKESFPGIVQNNISRVSWSDGGNAVICQKEVRIAEDESGQEETAGAEETTNTEEGSEAADTAGKETVQPEEETESDEEPETVEVWVEDDGTTKTDMDDDAQLDTLLSSITGITFSDCADYYMEEEEKEQYGFNGKTIVLTVSYQSGEEEKQVTLTIGSMMEDESAYYVRMDDSRMVNLISADTVEKLAEGFKGL